jgi:DNA-binding NtrC family response regulator
MNQIYPGNPADKGTLEKLRVLVIDDERYFTEELVSFFEHSGFEAFQANTGADGLSMLEAENFDLLILDVKLPGIDGLDILKEVKQKYQNLEVIIVSAHGDIDTVIKAMRLGALDYLRKPFRHLDIQIAIERTQRFLQLYKTITQIQEKNSLISKSLEERIERNFIGVSKKILDVLGLAMTAAQFSDTNVMITGESGTGKENIARIIHYASKRKDNLLISVNAGAISETLMESEFFGHKKGSFTGALSDKKGFFETSNNGTLFLDEISEMPATLQVKVLRAIENKRITRVGDTHEIATNFRIISATNQELDELVEAKKFRLDLLHRLNTLHIHIPPIRERIEDIEPLLLFFIEHFAKQVNKPVPVVDKNVVQALKEYTFPGNVRELRNMTERAVILCDKSVLGVQDFRIKTKQEVARSRDSRNLNLRENEVELIRQALVESNFNQNMAAGVLGIQRMALSRKLKKYNISFADIRKWKLSGNTESEE